MIIKHTLTILLISLCSSYSLAEENLQKTIYDGAEEMIRFDEKLNQAIREHNQIEDEDDIDLNNMQVNDFLETPQGYLLEQEIENYEETEVNVKIENDLLIISTQTLDKDFFSTELNNTKVTTVSSLSVSLIIPNNADQNKMQKRYSKGLLTVTFPYKSK